MKTIYTNFRWSPTGEPQEMLVEDGRVIERRRAEQPPPHRTPNTGHPASVDLRGQYLHPAFVDPHCHILPTGLDLRKLHLGDCASHGDVLDKVRERNESQPEGWLHAVHYDQTRYGGVHLTRHELDRISATRPILLRHSNGHASVANTAALRAAGVDETTPDPPGGSYRRGDDGAPDGVLFEHAHEYVTNATALPNLEEMVDAILAAGELMRGMGIACATDMMTGRFDLRRELRAYRLAAERGCAVRTRLYLQWTPVFGPRAVPREEIEEIHQGLDPKLCRIAGVKIFADGAIGSATAAIYGRYTGELANGAIVSRSARPATEGAPEGAEVSGQVIYPPDRLRAMVHAGHEAGYAVATHAIGNYAVDLVMDAYEATGEPARHRIEHAMLLSDAQIARLARLGSPVCFQPEFLLRFGHAYLRQLGPERTATLKRVRSTLDADIPVCFGSDRPIVPGNPRDAMQTAILRPTIYDPSENCTPEEALLAHTVWAARTNGDEDMGTLEPGSLADFTLAEGPLLTQ